MDLSAALEGKLSEETKEPAEPEHLNGEQITTQDDATEPHKDEHQFQTAISAWRSMMQSLTTVSR